MLEEQQTALRMTILTLAEVLGLDSAEARPANSRFCFSRNDAWLLMIVFWLDTVSLGGEKEG
jgi:hypothetical protein